MTTDRQLYHITLAVAPSNAAEDVTMLLCQFTIDILLYRHSMDTWN